MVNIPLGEVCWPGLRMDLHLVGHERCSYGGNGAYLHKQWESGQVFKSLIWSQRKGLFLGSPCRNSFGKTYWRGTGTREGVRAHHPMPVEVSRVSRRRGTALVTGDTNGL